MALNGDKSESESDGKYILTCTRGGLVRESMLSMSAFQKEAILFRASSLGSPTVSLLFDLILPYCPLWQVPLPAVSVGCLMLH